GPVGARWAAAPTLRRPAGAGRLALLHPPVGVARGGAHTRRRFDLGSPARRAGGLAGPPPGRATDRAWTFRRHWPAGSAGSPGPDPGRQPARVVTRPRRLPHTRRRLVAIEIFRTSRQTTSFCSASPNFRGRSRPALRVDRLAAPQHLNEGLDLPSS